MAFYEMMMAVALGNLWITIFLTHFSYHSSSHNNRLSFADIFKRYLMRPTIAHYHYYYEIHFGILLHANGKWIRNPLKALFRISLQPIAC